MPKTNTRAHILQTAAQLFYQKGYNLTGINEIIAEAGIAKATLYSHFKSKDELCLAYLSMKDEELLQSLRAFCLAQEAGNDRLLAILDFLQGFFEQEGFKGCWCIRTLAEVPEESVAIRAKIRSNKQLLLDYIQELVRENRAALDREGQLRLGRRIYLMYESAVMESYLQGADWPIQENRAILAQLLA